MNPQLRRITAPFGPLHESFLEHVETVFSTSGRARMRLIVRSLPCDGWQLATVGTLPGWRHRGLSRQLIEWALCESGMNGRPIILFANDSVIDFYSRFGFRRAVQWHFTDVCQVEPAKQLAVRLDVARIDDRVFLANHCSRASPTGRRFGARDYYSSLLFHLTVQELPVYWLEREQAVIIAGHEGSRLIIHDLLPTQPFDLLAAVPQVAVAAATSISFGFDPEEWWPSRRTLYASPSTDLLFIWGAIDLPDGPFRVPDLAQT